MDVLNDFAAPSPLILMNTIAPGLAVSLRQILLPALDEYCCLYVKQRKLCEQTSALIGRILARRKNSFRRMIGFRVLCKINAALCRSLRINVLKHVQIFTKSLMSDNDSRKNNNVPTRSSLQFLLTRLLVSHKNYERIQILTTNAASYFVKMVKTNHYFDISSLCIAIFGRVYSFSSVWCSRNAELFNLLQCNAKSFPADATTPCTSLAEFRLLEQLEVPVPPVDILLNSMESSAKQSSIDLTARCRLKKKTSLSKDLDIGIEIKRKQ